MTRPSPRGAHDAADDDLPLDVTGLPVSMLPGAGPATSARLVDAGLATVGDLLAFVPKAYDDLRTFTPLAALGRAPEGAVALVRGTVARVSSLPGRFLAVHLEDGGARAVARWFRVPAGMARAFEKGKVVALAGPIRFDKGGQPELQHPTNVTATLASAGEGVARTGTSRRPGNRRSRRVRQRTRNPLRGIPSSRA